MDQYKKNHLITNLKKQMIKYVKDHSGYYNKNLLINCVKNQLSNYVKNQSINYVKNQLINFVKNQLIHFVKIK